MGNKTRKFLVAGFIASALTFVGCKHDTSADKMPPPDSTMQTPPPATDGTTGPGTQSRPPPPGTESNPGTGGSGNISTTKQSDDNLRMPQDDPMRTKSTDSIRDSESEQGVHDNSVLEPNSGTGGGGFNNGAVDESLNEGGNVDSNALDPQAPLDRPVPYNPLRPDSQIPEGSR